MKEHRKLAAIMFTDIVGYTALMSKDEKNALKILSKNRELQKTALHRFNGEFIKEIGDGILSIFQSSFDAVSCAMELQNTLNRTGYYQLRIGIHTGDIVVSEKDVFGDGVNIASHIQAICEPGGILISEKVYDDIKNKIGIAADCLGEKSLKNIKDPVKIYSLSKECYHAILEQGKAGSDQRHGAVMDWVETLRGFLNRRPALAVGVSMLIVIVALGAYFIVTQKQDTSKTFQQDERSANQTGKKTWTNSIAVLPFTDLSPDKDQEYFCDGMAEELIGVMAHIPGLKVVARTSAFSFKGKEINVRDIGRELKVNAILEGSVRKSDNQLRISVQLIDVQNGYHLWSQTFDRELKDVFRIQDEIASAIASALKTRLLTEDNRYAEKKQTQNTQAYEFYLKGRFFCNQRSEEALEKSIAYFEQAIAADPDYALAYAGLADALLLQTWWGWNERPAGYEKAKELALLALDLDGSLAEACATLGSILCYHDWKWEESRKMLKQAIQLNPNYAAAHQYYAELLDILDENNAARAEINLAIELDPVFFMNQSLSCIYFIKEGRYDEALEANIRAQELDPDYIFTYLQFFTIYFYQDKDFLAIETLQEFLARDMYTSKHASTVEAIYDSAGMEGLWNLLITLWQTDPSPTFSDIAWACAILKDKEGALNWMEKAVDGHSAAIPRIMSYPEYHFLRDDPRYLALIERMGLTSYHKQAAEFRSR